MSSDNEKPQPERHYTDESLRNEREKTDKEGLTKQAVLEEDATSVVDRARVAADDVLRDARNKADQKLEDRQPSVQARARVEQERIQEDETLKGERAIEDKTLQRERRTAKRALADLLRVEREVTDQGLLTERTRSDQVLATRDNFLGMVSHDLRTLLAGISLQAQWLARSASEDEAGKKTLKSAQIIQRITVRMNRLIGDLMDVAAIEAAKLVVVPERNDVASLLSESIEVFQPVASNAGISLDADITSDTIPARFDPERVLQVLANLVSNAIKFTPRGGRISIDLEVAGQDVRVSVADTGAGIPDDKLEAIFERFWQVNPSDRRGLGLGLYISKSIVEAHGGRIWAESRQGVGAGSTFYFTLPRAC